MAGLAPGRKPSRARHPRSGSTSMTTWGGSLPSRTAAVPRWKVTPMTRWDGACRAMARPTPTTPMINCWRLAGWRCMIIMPMDTGNTGMRAQTPPNMCTPRRGNCWACMDAVWQTLWQRFRRQHASYRRADPFGCLQRLSCLLQINGVPVAGVAPLDRVSVQRLHLSRIQSRPTPTRGEIQQHDKIMRPGKINSAKDEQRLQIFFGALLAVKAYRVRRAVVRKAQHIPGVSQVVLGLLNPASHFGKDFKRRAHRRPFRPLRPHAQWSP